jgi:hypothetical protein
MEAKAKSFVVGKTSVLKFMRIIPSRAASPYTIWQQKMFLDIAAMWPNTDGS